MRARIVSIAATLLLALTSSAQAAPITFTFTAVVDRFEALGPGSWQAVPEALGSAITGSVTYDADQAMVTESMAENGIYASFWKSHRGCYKILADGSCGATFGTGMPIVLNYSASVEFGGHALAPLATDSVLQSIQQGHYMSPNDQWGLSTQEARYSIPAAMGEGWYTYFESVTSFGLSLIADAPELLFVDSTTLELPRFGPNIDAHVYGSNFSEPLYCSVLGGCGPLPSGEASGYRFGARLTSLIADEVRVVPEPSALTLLLGSACALAIAGQRLRRT